MNSAPIAVIAGLSALATHAAIRARDMRASEGALGHSGARVAQGLAVTAIAAAICALHAGDARTVSETTALGWVLAHTGNVPEAHQWLLVDVPRAFQAVSGGALLLALGLVTTFSLVHRFGRRAWWLAGAVALGWAGVYSTFPFHLSDAGFDDLFVVGKFAGPLATTEGNSKPFFTLWDYTYRFAAALDRTGDTGAPFAANGVLYLVYLAQVALLLVLAVGERAVERFGVRAATCLLALVCVIPGGALLLSHTVFYELGGAVVLLTAVTTIELARRAHERVDEPRATDSGGKVASGAAILGTIAFVSLVQRVSFGINGYVLLPVLLHGAWALATIERRSGTTALGLATVAASLVAAWVGLAELTVAALRHRNLPPLASELSLAMGVILPGLVIMAVRRSGAEVRLRWLRAPSTRLIAATYLVVLIPFAWFSNQFSHPWLFASWTSEPWYFAANHARNTVALYPFLAAGLASLLLAMPSVPSWTLALALTAAALGWSVPYTFRFYLASQSSFCDAGPVYQRNRRPLDAAAERLGPREDLLYLPLGRDHGDHFIARVVRPEVIARNACDGPPPAAGEHLIVSRWSLCARSLETGARITAPARSGTGGARDLADKSWEITMIPGEEVDEIALARWCDWEAGYRAGR